MQIYDEANALARAIRESEDCRAYRQLRQKIESDETARALLREYKKLQMQLQLAAVAGAEVSNDDTQRFQQIGALLFAGENTSRFLLLEMRLQQTMADVFKTLSDAAGLDMPGM
ncbi:MAG: YlbF family regulator [Eubacteriales bacterium]|nr:YlbF family regulator [Eubacteriales bacterium]